MVAAQDLSGSQDGEAHRAAFLGRSGIPLEGVIEAPFHAEVRDYVVAAVAFAPEALRRCLHPSLQPVPGATGIVAGYCAPTVLGGVPYAAAYVAAEIEGADSPDGSHGLATLAWCGTGETARALAVNSTTISVGEVAVSGGDGVITVRAQWPGGGELCLSVRPQPLPVQQSTIGQHFYIEPALAGGLTQNNVSYAAAFQAASLETLTYSARMTGQDLPPVKAVLWAAHAPWMKLTMGTEAPWTPPPFLTAPDDLVREFIDLLARMGLIGALVGPNGRLLAACPAALPLVERLGRRDLGRAAQGEVAVLALDIETGTQPVIARVLAVPSALLGLTAELLLFSNPAAIPSADLLLGLFGLTPAEARLAVAVGTGRGVEQAAVALGITVSTARSTLKLVFDKLGVSRQAELAALMARLG